MSKMGQYITEQIERGNYIEDDRGNIDVSLSNREERRVPTRKSKTSTKDTLRTDDEGKRSDNKDQ